MVNNSTNIYKANNHFLPQIIEYKEGHDIWRWKSRFCVRTGTTNVAAGTGWSMTFQPPPSW